MPQAKHPIDPHGRIDRLDQLTNNSADKPITTSSATTTTSIVGALAVLVFGFAVSLTLIYEAPARRPTQAAIWVLFGSGVVAVSILSLGIVSRQRFNAKRIRALLEDSESVAITLAADRITQVLGPSESVIGIDRNSAIGLTIDEILPSPEIDRVRNAFMHALNMPDSPTRIEALPLSADGTLGSTHRYVDVAIRDRSSDRSVRSFIVTIRDATRTVAAQDQLNLASSIDPQTKLANRPRFIEMIDLEVHRARRSGAHVCVLAVGIDRYDHISAGFQEADVDEIVREIARRIRSTVRLEDGIGRVGPDCFAVLLGGLDQNIGRAYAVDVVDRIADAIASPFYIANTRLETQASIGVAHRERGKLDYTPSDLLTAAEEGLQGIRLNSHRWTEPADQ